MKTPMGNSLNKPYMELGGNQTTRKVSIDAQTVLKKTAIFLGGGGWKRDGGLKLKSNEKRQWGII